jgi:ubiquinone/menaquinone biosynthesis C-methylase UbiE
MPHAKVRAAEASGGVITATQDQLDLERLRRFASVGLCPWCLSDFAGATPARGEIKCPACSQPVRIEEGVVLAVKGEREGARMRGWATGIAEDMDGKAASYANKYERRTRASAGFFVRRELALELAGPAPGRVLEPGCGPGVVAPLLSSQGLETYGLDLSAGQLRTAAASDPRSLYVQGDLRSLPYKAGVFDTVMLLGVLEYVEVPEQVLRELARVMTPKGRLIVTVPNSIGLVRLWTQHVYLRLSRLAKRLLGRPVPAYSRRLYSAHALRSLLAGANLRCSDTRFFDIVLAAPPFDRLLSNDPPILAAFLERRLRGPLRTMASSQIIMSAAKADS